MKLIIKHITRFAAVLLLMWHVWLFAKHVQHEAWVSSESITQNNHKKKIHIMMTQQYLDHLFENYPSVENFYWTVDGTAFATPEEAKAYSKKLGDPLVKVLPFLGKLEDAVDADLTEKPLGDTAGEYIDDTPTGDGKEGSVNTMSSQAAANTVNYEEFHVSTLKALCKSRGIDLNGATRKPDIIALLVAADEAGTNNTTPVDYTTMNLAQLQALCTDRSIEFTENDDEADLIALLEAADEAAANNTTPVDYTTMNLEQLQALCTDRSIEFTENDDEAALIALLEAAATI